MTKTRIGIVGGGLAGLTTAYKLSQETFSDDQKIEITLLEATSNLGGRVRTLRHFSSDLYAEAGALTLCDHENEIQDLVKELKLELIDRSTRAVKKYHSSSDTILWVESQQNSYFKKYILRHIPRSIHELHSSEYLKLDEISLIDFLKQKVYEHNLKIEKEDKTDNVDSVIHAIKISILGLHCDDFSKVSALHALRWIGQYINTKKSFSIKGGNDQLPLALAKAAKSNGVTILNKTAVIKIKRPIASTDSRVTLTILNPEKQKKSLEFDYVVLAVPLSALQKSAGKEIDENHIEFEPSLSEDRRKAIEAIPYNRSVARIYFEFNNQFWLGDHQKTAMTILDNPTVWIEDHTDHLESKSAVLEVHATGEAGQAIQQTNAIESAKKELENVWGDDISKHLSSNKPIGFFWNEEFYQQGAYPYLGVGQAHYSHLISQKLPSLSFAGEYTDTFSPSSMNGAIKSALRVINELKTELTARQTMKKTVTHSNHSYSFWLKTGAIVGIAAVGIATLYKKTHKP